MGTVLRDWVRRAASGGSKKRGGRELWAAVSPLEASKPRKILIFFAQSYQGKDERQNWIQSQNICWLLLSPQECVHHSLPEWNFPPLASSSSFLFFLSSILPVNFSSIAHPSKSPPPPLLLIQWEGAPPADASSNADFEFRIAAMNDMWWTCTATCLTKL